MTLTRLYGAALLSRHQVANESTAGPEFATNPAVEEPIYQSPHRENAIRNFIKMAAGSRKIKLSATEIVKDVAKRTTYGAMAGLPLP
ncbi:uncharacterized protein G6M90_00g049580 [Metarhizium brunneum]|uniref:Uncharacterized protein n=1 Tax=Metarhizium brunneum TaxID=500148 RepID=A0A7D5Z0Z0_9HYPO|nr:hypothetical protein G6M90_00g049580 [Metarhizium brunneum]